MDYVPCFRFYCSRSTSLVYVVCQKYNIILKIKRKASNWQKSINIYDCIEEKGRKKKDEKYVEKMCHK